MHRDEPDTTVPQAGAIGPIRREIVFEPLPEPSPSMPAPAEPARPEEPARPADPARPAEPVPVPS
jgi:hypothetical protein